MGRETFERALTDPDSLVEIEFGPGREQTSFFESFAYVAMQTYERKSGQEIPWDRPWPEDAPCGDEGPRGRQWGQEELAERVPRLWQAAKAANRLP